MNDTVSKLMGKVHAIENLASLAADPTNSESEQAEYVSALLDARQALQDELVRLFTPLSEDRVECLYANLRALSKSLEGSGRIDEHDNPDAYATILDAMVFVQKHGITGEKNETDE